MRSLPALLALTVASGCAHHHLPGTRLETPEACGPGRVGRVELLAVGMGTDLSSPASTVATETATEDVLQKSFLNAALGFSYAAQEKLDVGIRIAPYVPPMVRGKYQLSGEPETRAKAGDFSTAVSAGAGLLSGADSYFLLDGSLLLGYRAWARHLFSAGGSFASASVAAGGASQLGGFLGYQYNVEDLVLRSELAYTSGGLGSAKLGGIFLGALIGFKL